METFLLPFAVLVLTSGVHGVSQSMSCSSINGKMICNRESSSGNVAVSGAQSFIGAGGEFQRTMAGTGDSYTGDSSISQSQAGDIPPLFSYDTYPSSSGGAGAVATSGGFGYPSPGVLPLFYPGFGYPPRQDAAGASAGASSSDVPVQPQAQAQPQPQPQPQPQAYYPPFQQPSVFNPFSFVQNAMGGGGAYAGGGAFAGGGGAFAGAGAFPFPFFGR